LALSTRSDAQGLAARWIAATIALAGVLWITGLAGLLAVAGRMHVDIPYVLAVKLPLLQSRPTLIFAGDSRTAYQVDAGLAAGLIGKPAGAAVNIAYDAGEPLAVLAAVRAQPAAFASAHVVVSVAPFTFNEGVHTVGGYPQDVVARLGVVEKMRLFLPWRSGTLIYFIREAFNARLASELHLAERASQPANYGLSIIPGSQRDDEWPPDLGTHTYYANWNLSGPKARFETAALCETARLVRRLTVVVPPWAPRYHRADDSLWRTRDEAYAALVADAGRRCGFDVLNIQAVPGLGQADYADEMHIKVSGIPVYTRYLVAQLRL
jgi:hypothetical protein